MISKKTRQIDCTYLLWCFNLTSRENFSNERTLSFLFLLIFFSQKKIVKSTVIYKFCISVSRKKSNTFYYFELFERATNEFKKKKKLMELLLLLLRYSNPHLMHGVLNSRKYVQICLTFSCICLSAYRKDFGLKLRRCSFHQKCMLLQRWSWKKIFWNENISRTTIQHCNETISYKDGRFVQPF